MARSPKGRRGRTQDGHLLALDARTGVLLWDRRVVKSRVGGFLTAAPLVWKDMVFIGKAGADCGAFEVRRWRSRPWRYRLPTLASVTPTAGRLLFTGDVNGEFLAMDAVAGDILYRFDTGGLIAAGVVTCQASGRQYVAVASGDSSRTSWHTTGSPTLLILGF